MLPVLPSDWRIVYVHRRGVIAGAFVVRENEIHCERHAVFDGCWLTRQDLERLTKPLFSEYGFIRTSVRESNEEGHRFVKRLGFMETRRENGLRHYETKRIKHARL